MVISVIGETFVDIVVPFNNMTPGETYFRRIKSYPGGLLNMAITIVKLGHDVRYLGKVGNDCMGEFVRSILSESKVKNTLFIDRENATGTCVSLITKDGERLLIADRGANDTITKKEIDRYLSANQNVDFLYLSGYSMINLNARKRLLYMIKECHIQGALIAFNPGSSNIINKDSCELIKKHVDYLILNFSEAQVLCQEQTPQNVYEKIVEFAPTTVITRGGDGCSIISENDFSILNTVKKNYLDTTGAGDAFSAGFMIAKIKGFSNVDSAKFANQTANNHLMQRN